MKSIAIISMKSIFLSLGLALVLNTICFAKVDKGIKDGEEQSKKSARVFKEIMNAPDNTIPKDLIEKCECVAVFPSVLKAGFIVGGRGGRGVASCRTEKGWSAPAYFNLGGASFGLQIGAQSTDFVLLFMNKHGFDSLLSDKFEIGADASVAAGPVGRQTGASTDIKMESEILSYSRSRGLFAGLELKGVVISADKEDMKNIYGENITAKEVLQGQVTTPASVKAFPDTLTKCSPHKNSK